MDDADRRAIARSELNATAAEAYHKELIKMQAENKRLRGALKKIALLDSGNGMCGEYSSCDSPDIAKQALEED